MKLSNKLFLSLILIILGILVYQAFVSKKVISDAKKLADVNSPTEIRQIAQGLKTYECISGTPFSSIIIGNNLYVQIMKGSSFEVFYSQYHRIDVSIENNQLTITGENSENNFSKHNGAVYIFLPEDPQTIIFKDDVKQNRYLSTTCIYGFEGSHTQIQAGLRSLQLYTDMQNVNLKSSSLLSVYPSTLDPTKVIDQMNLFVQTEGNFALKPEKMLKKINVDIKANNGDFDLSFDKETQVGLLKIDATFEGKDLDPKQKDRLRSSYLYGINSCDSLILHLNNLSGKVYQLSKPATITANYESIQLNSITVADQD